jgi:hypothetical protein
MIIIIMSPLLGSNWANYKRIMSLHVGQEMEMYVTNDWQFIKLHISQLNSPHNVPTPLDLFEIRADKMYAADFKDWNQVFAMNNIYTKSQGPCRLFKRTTVQLRPATASESAGSSFQVWGAVNSTFFATYTSAEPLFSNL